MGKTLAWYLRIFAVHYALYMNLVKNSISPGAANTARFVKIAGGHAGGISVCVRTSIKKSAPRLFSGHAVSSSKALFFHLCTYTRVISGSPSPWAMQRNSQPYRS